MARGRSYIGGGGMWCWCWCGGGDGGGGRGGGGGSGGDGALNGGWYGLTSRKRYKVVKPI